MPDEKASLMRAVTALGHDAHAIMPKEMEIEINKVTRLRRWFRASGDGRLGRAQPVEGDPRPGAERRGQATGMGSDVADLPAGEVRDDIKRADARSVAGTLTRDLVYPLLAFNLSGLDNLRRCPRFEFDLGEAEDFKLYADVHTGRWRHPHSGELGAQLRIPKAGERRRFSVRRWPLPRLPPRSLFRLAAIRQPAAVRASGDPGAILDTADQMTPALATAGQPSVDRWVTEIEGMLANASSLEEFRAQLLARYENLPANDLVEVAAAALAAIELRGRAEVLGA